jgi:cytochrome c553
VLSTIALAAVLGIPRARASEETVDRLTETALAAKADPKRGHAQFDHYCAQCHGPGGRADANHRIPVLAGQRSAYLVRQLASLSGEQRESVNMHRGLSAAELRAPQTWADVAAYLNGAPPPAQPQTGDGRDLGLGEATFHVECASCHYDDARGDDDGLVPSLRNQHYTYLLSQIRRLSQLHRHNVDENIARLLRSLKPDEASAVADYLSRLRSRPQDPQPEREQ